MSSALAMGSNDNGTALVIMIQVILKGGPDIGIGQVECKPGRRRILRIISAQMGLPVPGRKYPVFIKNAGLEKDRGAVGLLIKRRIAQIGIPFLCASLRQRGGMYKKDVYRGIFQKIGPQRRRDAVRRILLIWMGRPVTQAAIIRPAAAIGCTARIPGNRLGKGRRTGGKKQIRR